MYELDALIDKKYLLFGGKGGVGKTTCAGAFALACASLDYPTLIVSTDPAHSLGDRFYGRSYCFGVEPKQVYDGVPLFAADIDLKSCGVSESTPGSDEFFAFTNILGLMNNPDLPFEKVVFDTAPTGHTLRLLGVADALDSYAGRLVKFGLSAKQGFFRVKSKITGGEFNPSNTLEAVNYLQELTSNSKNILRDPDLTGFVPVLIPEEMAVFETERLLSSLLEYEVPVSNIIVNNVWNDVIDTPVIPDVEGGKEFSELINYCRRITPVIKGLNSRAGLHKKNLKTIRDFWSDDYLITEIPLILSDLKDRDMLEVIVAEHMFPHKFSTDVKK